MNLKYTRMLSGYRIKGDDPNYSFFESYTKILPRGFRMSNSMFMLDFNWDEYFIFITNEPKGIKIKKML